MIKAGNVVAELHHFIKIPVGVFYAGIHLFDGGNKVSTGKVEQVWVYVQLTIFAYIEVYLKHVLFVNTCVQWLWLTCVNHACNTMHGAAAMVEVEPLQLRPG